MKPIRNFELKMKRVAVGEAVEPYGASVLGYSETSRGGIDTCPVDPRIVFRTAVAVGASSLIAIPYVAGHIMRLVSRHWPYPHSDRLFGVLPVELRPSSS